MSIAAKRQEFADALSTVDGVRGYAYRPETAKEGDAYPMWGGETRDSGEFFVSSWDLVIVLPDRERDADDWISSHEQELYDAIQPVAHIVSFQPAQLAGPKNGLIITTRSE